jgi:uncharacterized protein (DUF1501 family)
MLNRRHFLRHLGGTACAASFLHSMSAEAASNGDTIVVCIALYGGNDGINTVIPMTQYNAYQALRTPAALPAGSTLAFSEEALAPLAFDAAPATPANGATQFAFAPSMGIMRNLYATGRLAVITGAGVPPAEQYPTSHPNGYADWMTGQINISPAAAAPAGWLGSTFDGGKFGPLGPAVSVAGFQQIIAGHTHPGMVVSQLTGFGPSYPRGAGPILAPDLANLLAAPAPNATAHNDAAAQALAAAQVAYIKRIATATPLADYPPRQSALDDQLFTIAQMIIGGAGVRGYVANQGSYDSHANQAATQPALLAQLSYSMSSFYRYLESKNVSHNVVVMTVSDFGRAIAANANLGTDHGGSNVVFVLGDKVKGGVYGNYPSLTAPYTSGYGQGNLVTTVDFRNIFSDLILSMGGNPRTVIGQTFPRLGFI